MNRMRQTKPQNDSHLQPDEGHGHQAWLVLDHLEQHDLIVSSDQDSRLGDPCVLLVIGDDLIKLKGERPAEDGVFHPLTDAPFHFRA
jgi:hypothetical protein